MAAPRPSPVRALLVLVLDCSSASVRFSRLRSFLMLPRYCLTRGRHNPWAAHLQQLLGLPTVVNTAEALGVAGNQRFARPEITTTLEIGFKTRFSWGSLDVALFDQTIEDFQSSIFQGAGFAVVNAGEQTSQGLEFDSTINPPAIPGLTFTLSGIWIPGRIVLVIPGVMVEGMDYTSTSRCQSVSH